MLPARLLAALLVLAVPSAVIGQPTRELMVRLTETPQGIRLDTIGRQEKIAAPVERTFEALKLAYAEFEIPRNTESSQYREIGNTQLATRRSFAKERISKSLDCGRGLTGEYADQYRVTIAVVSWVSPLRDRTDSSTIHTALVGGGRATDGSTAWPLQCASLGAFERRLANRVRAVVTTLP
jgi:hypothetical protein